MNINSFLSGIGDLTIKSVREKDKYGRKYNGRIMLKFAKWKMHSLASAELLD